MPGIDNTGLSSSQLVTLGRGEVFFTTTFTPEGRPIGFRTLGNTPSFSFNVESETLEHRDSRQGLRVVDVEVKLSQDTNINLTLDHLSFDNLALFLSGDVSTFANTAAISGITEWEWIPQGSIVVGRTYEITDDEGNRAYNIDADDLTLATTNATPVTLVEGVDYTVDEQFGTVFLIHDSTVLATAIGNDEGIDLTLAAKAGAGTLQRVTGQTVADLSGAMRVVHINAVNNRRSEIFIPRVQLSADGDFSLIGEEFIEMSLTGKVQGNLRWTEGPAS